MKGFGTLLLLIGAGAAGGYVIGRALGETEEEKKKFGERGLFIGAGAGFAGKFLLDYLRKEKPDTVNYTLHHRKKRVYDGICYDHRLDTRINEHIKDGKIFDTVVYDNAKPRGVAMNLERKRIRRFVPKYNVQHKVA